MLLSLYNDVPAGASDSNFQRFQNERVLERLRTLDLALSRDGTVRSGACDPGLFRSEWRSTMRVPLFTTVTVHSA